MRAIPFRVVCLLGMNDGDFPRPVVRADFDLMQGDWRPGDRSRRDDDRYLLLEALLSARDQLYISWIGRDVRDHSERVPSVLIGHLRDHVAAGWRLAGHEAKADALLRALSTEHPLQPFSPRYFAPDAPPAPALDGFYSYGREWQAAHGAQAGDCEAQEHAALPPMQPERALSLRQLADFLAQPIEAFFAQRLQVRFNADEEQTQDEELFALDGLQKWQLEAELRAALQSWADAQPSPGAARVQIDSALAEHTAPLLRAGRLPLQAFGELAAQQLARALNRTLEHYLDARVQWPQPEPQAHALRWADAASGLRVEDALPARHLPAEPGDGATPARIALADGRLHKGKDMNWRHIVRHWPAHLALQIAAGPTRTVLASETGLVRLAPMRAHDAEAALATLMQGWAEGMRQPLPLACNTGFMALIEDDAGGRRTAQTYDGGFQQRGEVERTALARVYPDFASLVSPACPPLPLGEGGGEGRATVEIAHAAHGGAAPHPASPQRGEEPNPVTSAFHHWVQQLYRPLWNAIESAKPQAEDAAGGDAA